MKRNGRIVGLLTLVFVASVWATATPVLTRTMVITNIIPTHINTITILDLDDGYMTVKYQTCEPALLELESQTWGQLETIKEGNNIVAVTPNPVSVATVRVVAGINDIPTLTFTEALYCYNPKFYIYTLKKVQVTITKDTTTVITLTIPKVFTATYQTLSIVTLIDGSTYTAYALTTSVYTSAVKSYVTSVIKAGAVQVFTVPMLLNTSTVSNVYALRVKKVEVPVTDTTVTYPLFDLQHSGTIVVHVSFDASQLINATQGINAPIPMLLAPLGAAIALRKKARIA